MIKLTDILLEQTRRRRKLRNKLGPDVTQDVMSNIQGLFDDSQWNNFQNLWSNIDADSHTWLGKKNIPLSISYAPEVDSESYLSNRAYYDPKTNTIMVPRPQEYQSLGMPIPTDEELMQRYPNASSVDQAFEYHKNDFNKNEHLRKTEWEQQQYKELANNVFAELAHAQEYANRKKNPISKLTKGLKDFKTDVIPAIATGDSSAGPGLTKLVQTLFPKRQYDRYRTQGTDEHRTHAEIEPKLYTQVFGDNVPDWAYSMEHDHDFPTIKQVRKDKHDHTHAMHEGKIKLKNILLEGMNKKDIMDVVKKVYPHIVNDLGGRACKVEVHNNLYKRLGAVGIEDLMKDNNPYAQYDWEKKKIYLYSSAINNVEQIIRSLLHEHTHSRQNKKIFDRGYDEKKYTYDNHPYEMAAVKSEKKWKRYIKYINK